MPETPEGRIRLVALETHVDLLDERLNRLEEKLDLLIQCEADRKADDRALRRYASYGFWALVSLGGFINWDKISKALDTFLHQMN